MTEDQVQEKDGLIRQMFNTIDVDRNCNISFVEFLRIHEDFVHVAGEEIGHKAVSSMSKMDVESQFKSFDYDRSMALDWAEWIQYMDGMLAVLGFRSWAKACKCLLEEAQRKSVEKGKFDFGASDRLLEKTATATSLVGAQVLQDAKGLLEKKADPNFRDGYGNCALIHAADKADVAFIKLLLDARAETSNCNKSFDSAPLIAARGRNLEALRVLLSFPESGDGINSDHLVASKQLVKGMSTHQEKDIRDLVSKKVDINYRDANGWCPLTAAVFWGKKECVETLLRQQQLYPWCKIKIDMQNTRGRSALHIASRKGLVEFIPPLMGARANPDLQDTDGWTPLHHAAFNGNDEVVEALVENCANTKIKGKLGMTAWMTSCLPARAGNLSEKSQKLLMPSENIQLSKCAIPILNQSNLATFEKLEQILSLPGVQNNPESLRMYEQFFHVRTGPNKVRLRKFWENLVEDLVKRLRSGNVDLDCNDPRLSSEQQAARIDDCAQRMKLQKTFLKIWLEETKGPVPSMEWRHDSREALREDLDKTIMEERDAFHKELDALYENLKQQEFGGKLCGIEPMEVLDEQHRSQVSAHPILPWLDSCDPVEAVEALRCLTVEGMGKDSESTLMAFMDLCNSELFDSAFKFWSNIYKLWLQNFLHVAHIDFVQKIKSIVADFTQKHENDPEFETELYIPPMKTFERMQEKEREYGQVGAECYQSRTVASNLLDILRLSITVDTAKAAYLLLEEHFRPLKFKEHKINLVCVKNDFSEKADVPSGYREVILNLFWNSGARKTLCDRPGKELLIGAVVEVKIILRQFLAVKKRMHLISKYSAGEFDHRESLVSDERGDAHNREATPDP